MIQFLLQANPAATKIRGEGNLVPLHNALFNESDRRINIVKCLLQADPTAAKLVNFDGDTSYHLALDQECGRELLEQLVKAFPEGVTIPNDIGKVVLFCKSGSLINAFEGYLPLHAACFTKDMPRTKENVELLLYHYPEATRASSSSGFLPAHIAAELSTSEVLKSILSAYPEGVNNYCPVDNNHTPLFRAIIGNNHDTVKFICEEYPTAVKAVNSHGMNPLHVACEGESIDIIKLIYHSFPANIECKDLEGRCPLQVFIQSHPDIPSENCCEMTCLRFLIRQFPDAVGMCDNHNETPLTLCPPQNYFLKRLLLMAKPEINSEELRMYNYLQRRMGIFLAFSAINADGIPNIFAMLRGTNPDLLKLTLSFL